MESGNPARDLLLAGLLFLALGTCGAPYPRTLARSVAAEAPPRCGDVEAYYRTHPRALWIHNGALTAHGSDLVRAFAGAGSDGLNPASYAPARNERSLSAMLVRYVHDLNQPPANERPYYVDATLEPAVPCPSTILEQAAAAPSISAFLQQWQEPNGLAARLKQVLASRPDLLTHDLPVARSIGSPAKFVLVDTAAQRLWMIDHRQIAGTMKVVVGKSGMETPPMAALIRFAVVNPYWDIPPDLVQQEVAPHLVQAGPAYLATRNYEAVTSYDSSAVTLDPAAIDWRAVRDGSTKVGIRQLPGPDNMMGRVMFMFPNKFGIYLHDTPIRWLFSRTDRRVSHGCVRLEHAEALYQWLFGRALDANADAQSADRQDLGEPVPLYILHFSRGSLEQAMSTLG
jgi:murein L,D-transpeptidase YcbB/YkuD